MKFADYDKIVNGAKFRNNGGYAVQFHWIEYNGREMVPDSVPEIGERPFDTEIAAWEYASEMARKRSDVMCNIHVVHRGGRLDGRPVKDSAQKMLHPRGYVEHPPRVWGYCRGSTMDQVNTLQQQEWRIRTYKNGESTTAALPWADIVIEQGASASKLPWMDRPKASALHLSLNPGDHLIVVKSDRAFRNYRDQIHMFELWDKMGVFVHIPEVHMNTANPITRLASKMCVAMMGVWAEHEAKNLGDRVRESVAARRRAGKPLYYKDSRTPMGFRAARTGRGDWKYVPAVQERKLMKAVTTWMDAGWSPEKIYIHLLKHRIKNPRFPEMDVGRGWIIHAYINWKLIDACHKAGIDDTHVGHHTLKIPYNIKWPKRIAGYIRYRTKYRWIKEQDTSCLPLLPVSAPQPVRESELIQTPLSA